MFSVVLLDTWPMMVGSVFTSVSCSRERYAANHESGCACSPLSKMEDRRYLLQLVARYENDLNDKVQYHGQENRTKFDPGKYFAHTDLFCCAGAAGAFCRPCMALPI